MTIFDVIIVGGGVSGCSTAYHLSQLASKLNILLLECGELGKGRPDLVVEMTALKNSSAGDEISFNPYTSGSVVFNNLNVIKMIVTLYACKSKTFISHHGVSGISLYERISSKGRDLQVSLAKKLFGKEISYYLRELGSLMVCENDDLNGMEEEFRILKGSGMEVEWWDSDKVKEFHGADTKFVSGIFFPKDAVIDSVSYSKVLAKKAAITGENISIRENIYVSNIEEMDDGMIKVFTSSNEIFMCKKVVMATGGFLMDSFNLNGILRPCYSYLTSMSSHTLLRDSPNYFTFGFSHDWCFT
jgi:glycine/D-amino acid oxidase-like deaminating enzyme